MNSGLRSTTVMVNLEIQTVSRWLRDASVPLTATVCCGSGALTPVLLGGQPVAHGLRSCTITSLSGGLSSSVLKVILAPKTQLWEETSQTEMFRAVLTGHLKEQKVSKDVSRKDLRMTFGDL